MSYEDAIHVWLNEEMRSICGFLELEFGTFDLESFVAVYIHCCPVSIHFKKNLSCSNG